MDNLHQDLIAENVRLFKRINELETVLRKIAEGKGFDAAMARSALDTMKVLEE